MTGHQPNRRYNVLGQDLGGYKPPRDVALPVRSVACPQCGARPGAMCVSTVNGEPVRANHKRRRIMAVRARGA